MQAFERRVRAPAKVNLSLRIVGRRADGYHELDSIFVPVSVFDELRVVCEPAGETAVSCVCPGHPELEGDGNLAAKAARGLLARLGLTARLVVELDKRIWTAAGLGGGSSDAAAVLRAINNELATQCGPALPGEELAQLALSLGADVPFFLEPRPARAQGIGDVLTPVTGMPTLHLVLANPGEPVSTAAVYAGLGLEPGTRLDPSEQPTQLDGSLGQIVALMVNDLEPPAVASCPRIARLKQQLCAEGALAAAMSGSGATVFGLFPSAAAARGASGKISRMPDTYTEYAMAGCT